MFRRDLLGHNRGKRDEVAGLVLLHVLGFVPCCEVTPEQDRVRALHSRAGDSFGQVVRGLLRSADVVRRGGARTDGSFVLLNE